MVGHELLLVIKLEVKQSLASQSPGSNYAGPGYKFPLERKIIRSPIQRIIRRKVPTDHPPEWGKKVSNG